VGHHQLDALLWRKGILTSLGILSAVDINDRGVIAGSDDASGAFNAVVWNNAQVTALGTLPGDTSSAARAINRFGQVVGESSGDQGIHAFVWHNGQMIQLPGFLESPVRARDINNRGLIVGESATDPDVIGGAVRGILWTDGVPTNLGTLPGQPQSSAAAMNDHGLIVGYSGPGGFEGRAVAWIPRR
jgi:probable HAF family extracellular repeat protein